MPTWGRRIRMVSVLCLFVPAGVAALSLNAMADSPSPSPSASGSAAAIGDPAKGQQVYNQNCTSCHGASLEGTGLGPKLNPLTKLQGVADPKDPNYLIETITNGRPAADGFPSAMPAWTGKLSDQQINDVAAFILDENKIGGNQPLGPVDLARSNVFWVTVGIAGMVVITYLLAVYNMRWISRRAAARRQR
jgi:mono/diheme cytochrome c family protein